MHLLALALSAAPVAFADGGLTLAEVDDVVTFHGATLDECRPAKGTALLDFNVDADGGVTRAEIKRDSRPASGACFVQQLNGWQFPPRERETSVRYEWGTRKASPADAGTGLTVEALLAVQRVRRDEVAQCWLATRKSASNEGAFQTAVVIGRSGAVVDAQASSASPLLMGTDIGECVAVAVRRWRFPQAKSSTETSLSWLVAHDTERPLSTGDPDAVLATALETMTPTTGTRFFEPALLAPCASRVPAEAHVAYASVLCSLEPDAGKTVGVKSSPKLPELEACVAAAARAISREPAIDGGQRSLYGLRFTSDGGVAECDLPQKAMGGLAKDVIMKVIKEHQSQIKFCYETELQKQPQLAGKVAVFFTIGPTGSVLSASAAENTVNRAVAACILRRLATWQFPPPIGGGNVTVTFPWLFKPAGAEE